MAKPMHCLFPKSSQVWKKSCGGAAETQVQSHTNHRRPGQSLTPVKCKPFIHLPLRHVERVNILKPMRCSNVKVLGSMQYWRLGGFATLFLSRL